MLSPGVFVQLLFAFLSVDFIFSSTWPVTNMERRKNKMNSGVLNWKEIEVLYQYDQIFIFLRFLNRYLNIQVCFVLCVYYLFVCVCEYMGVYERVCVCVCVYMGVYERVYVCVLMFSLSRELRSNDIPVTMSASSIQILVIMLLKGSCFLLIAL